ncbi:MAG: thioredoxin family protein [Vulcanococcus sp.]
MSLTASTMLPLGTPLPQGLMETALEPVRGGPLRGEALTRRPLLVLFICPHCPFVKHIEPELTRLQRDFADQVAFVAIRSNSLTTHPQDGPNGMTSQARENGWRFPYLADDSQAVAKVFQAACTPDLYLFDAEQRLVYRGQLDGSRPGNNKPVDGRDLRAALEALLHGRPIDPEQRPSIGCNIKWHPEPDRGTEQGP